MRRQGALVERVEPRRGGQSLAVGTASIVSGTHGVIGGRQAVPRGLGPPPRQRPTLLARQRYMLGWRSLLAHADAARCVEGLVWRVGACHRTTRSSDAGARHMPDQECGAGGAY